MSIADEVRSTAPFDAAARGQALCGKGKRAAWAEGHARTAIAVAAGVGEVPAYVAASVPGAGSLAAAVDEVEGTEDGSAEGIGTVQVHAVIAGEVGEDGDVHSEAGVDQEGAPVGGIPTTILDVFGAVGSQAGSGLPNGQTFHRVALVKRWAKGPSSTRRRM